MLKIGTEGHRSHELLHLPQVSRHEPVKFTPCVLQSLLPTSGERSLRIVSTMEEPNKLQLTQFELKVAASNLQGLFIISGPLDRREQILVLLHFVKDVIHGGKLLPNLTRGHFREVKERSGIFGDAGAGFGVLQRYFCLRHLGQEGRSDGELPFSQKVHSDSPVDQVFLRCQGVMFSTREGSVLEQLFSNQQGEHVSQPARVIPRFTDLIKRLGVFV